MSVHHCLKAIGIHGHAKRGHGLVEHPQVLPLLPQAQNGVGKPGILLPLDRRSAGWRSSHGEQRGTRKNVPPNPLNKNTQKGGVVF